MEKTPLKFRKLRMDELDRRSLDEMNAGQKIPLVVVLDNIRSLHNVGSVFRSADAFTIEKICLCGITARPPHREIQKTALGATESVAWEYYDSTIDAVNDLIDSGHYMVAVEQTTNSTEPTTFTDSKRKYAIILGNEIDGVDQDVLELCNESLEIPQDGTKHSLNISVAAGIVMWHFYNLLSKA